MAFLRRLSQARLKDGAGLEPTAKEQGQALVETAVGLVFLLLVIIVLFELVLVLASYISLTNASIQGAIRAAGHPNMVPGDSHYDDYVSDMQGEILAGGLSWTDVRVNPPQLPATVVAGEPLTVTINYTLTTPFAELFLPFFGKFGLPASYRLTARSTVPIR